MKTKIILDNKKIEEAAYRFATSQEHGELLALINGYKEGYKDAINELIKNLWHPANKIPKSNFKILIKIKVYRLVISSEGKKEDICGYFYKVIKYNKKNKWKLTELEKEYQCNIKVIEWLYIDNLLPKK